MQKTITVKANSQRVEKVKGKVVACLSSTAPFLVELESGVVQELSAGRKITGSQFSRVRFTETSGSDNTIVIYIGDDDITLPNVVSSSSSSSTSIANSLAQCVEGTPAQLTKTVPTAGTPVALASSATYFRIAYFFAKPSASKVAANTGKVYIGASGSANSQPIILDVSGEYVLRAPEGSKWDFRNFYVDADNNGDGVVVLYS